MADPNEREQLGAGDAAPDAQPAQPEEGAPPPPQPGEEGEGEAAQQLAPGGLRICLLNMEANPESTVWGTYPGELAMGLARRGHQVTMLTAGDHPGGDLQGAGVEVVPLPMGELAAPRGEPVRFRLRFLGNKMARRTWWRASRGLGIRAETFGSLALEWLRPRREDFDLVHDNQTLDAALVQMARFLPVLATLHYPVERDMQAEMQAHEPEAEAWQLWYSLWVKAQKAVVPKLSGILCPSVAARSLVMEQLEAAEEQMLLCPAGVDRLYYQNIVQVQREPMRLISVLGSGPGTRLAIADLLGAMELLGRQVPEARLTLVIPEEQGAWTRSQIKDLNLGGWVECLDQVAGTRLAELYSAAAVAVVPESQDTAGIRVMEALSMNLPLVVSGPAATEIASDAGLSVPPRDPRALAEGMARLLQDEGLRLRLRLNTNPLADAYGDWDEVALRHEEIYRALLQ